jgi:RHS repeat-associated protein
MTAHPRSRFPPYKFTGKERDSESGLDNFGARYLGSSMGRFMSPDPDQDAGFNHMDDPQSWNGYSYTRNNPLLYTDPAGTNYLVCDNDGKNCADLTDKQYEQFRKDNPNLRVTPSGDIYTINPNGTETKTGSETYYNEKDADAAAHIAAPQLLINEFMKQMTFSSAGCSSCSAQGRPTWRIRDNLGISKRAEISLIFRVSDTTQSC